VHQTVETTCAGDPRIKYSGPHVELQPKQAVTLVMALHELCTNAVKYGALQRDTGCVEITWELIDPVERRLTLLWRESGGPAVAPPERRGFGFRMIEQALAADLAGTVTMDFRPDGLVCTITGTLGHPEPFAPVGA